MILYITEDNREIVMDNNTGSTDGSAPSADSNTIYYGTGSVEDDRFKINIDSFLTENIDNNMLLITYVQDIIASAEDYTEKFIINGKETYEVIDSVGNNISLHDIANNNYSLFAFNGEKFILLTKQQLIDSHVSTAKDIAPTANQVRWLYEYFKEQIGDIPSVLDFINRTVV